MVRVVHTMTLRFQRLSSLMLRACLCLLLTTAAGGQQEPPITLHGGAEAPTTLQGEAESPLKGHVRIFESPNEDEGQSFWNQQAQDDLAQTLSHTLNTNVAKNVILFLGDGLGIPTITASRIYKGQKLYNLSGEEQQMVFETFPHVGLSKTYCVDKQVPDSACTGTAYLCGVKTRYSVLGVDASVRTNDCGSMTEDNKVSSIAHWALNAGKRSGVVTSTRVTHATPAALYSHVPDRDWECDAELTNDTRRDCPDIKDIARQLVEDEPGRSLHVILGGGFQVLSSNATNSSGDPVDEEACVRADGKDLFQLWQDQKVGQKESFRAVRTKSELLDPDSDEADYLLGIFSNSHLPYEHEKRQQHLDIPTLAEMTKEAINVLAKGEEGFFLLVEGGRIDHAHHDTTARKALEETLAFEEAIQTALDMLSTTDTLFVVTADHSHVMTINGYPDRGQDVTGLADVGLDGLPYTTLMYTNGVGFNYTVNSTVPGVGARWNISEDDVSSYDYLQLSAVPRDSESHGGEDVSIYAKGPMAHLFQGVHEQNYIAHAMAYASCVGPNKKHCSEVHTSFSPMPALAHGLLYCGLLTTVARGMLL